MRCIGPNRPRRPSRGVEEAAQKAESQAFRSWLICNWSSSLSIWTVLLLGYIVTMLAKGWDKRTAHAEGVSMSHSLGYYGLLVATSLIALANKLRNVDMVRGAFFLFGVLQAAITLHIGVSPDLPIPRMLEIESELGLEFISNLVVTAQLVLVDFKPVPRFLFLGMHTVCLVPFYMRVISYSAWAASLRAVSVYTLMYLAFAIIKQQLDSCFVQHQQRVQAEAQKTCAGRGQHLSARPSSAHPLGHLWWPFQQGSLIVGRGVPTGLLQQHGSPGASGGRQDAVLGGSGAHWRGSGGAKKQQSGGGDEQEQNMGAQGAGDAGYSALRRSCLGQPAQ
ncbi:hypothetical protein DUNSADRAFT_2828 [Dunaliella salina]|uniref:Uncharacterized protein n=1 Tax=Dunaliella salina TaxID=3046 RepID=A0ABQ7FVX3_DUNSA|nr:hypothetical protein DUNSADRAFT_2828 [Dunaliella salina]|eukprot:KAF5826521.1 hypothetical protein DUNSADRAFT_2828 [Dunaliella salina]